MENTLTIKTNPFRFNYIHLLVIIGFTLSVFVLTNILTAKHVAETAPDFGYKDAQGLMEEIYNGETVAEALKTLPLDATVVKKLTEEIELQLAKTADHPGCEVYNLVAMQNRDYPVLGYGDAVTGFQYLRIGEAWRIGMTCNGEDGRYTTSNYYKSKDGYTVVSNQMVRYRTIFRGTYKQAIILEKILIYTYPLWSGHPEYAKPCGNKIFR